MKALDRSPRLAARPKLSPENLRVLHAIEDHWRTCGTAPTLGWLGETLHYTSRSTVCYHVRRLERLGLVDYVRTGGGGYIAARSLLVTQKGKRFLRIL